MYAHNRIEMKFMDLFIKLKTESSGEDEDSLSLQKSAWGFLLVWLFFLFVEHSAYTIGGHCCSFLKVSCRGTGIWSLLLENNRSLNIFRYLRLQNRSSKVNKNGMADHKSFCHLMLPLNTFRKKVLDPIGGGLCLMELQTQHICMHQKKIWIMLQKIKIIKNTASIFPSVNRYF